MTDHPQQRPLYALGLRIAAVAMLSVMLALVKYAGETGISLVEIMFWRQFASLPFIMAYVLLTGGLAQLRSNRLGSHAARSAMGVAGMVANFGSAILLPLAVATTLGFTTPLFAVILSALWFREHVGPWRWTSVALGFTGVLIITQPGQEPISLIGAVAGLMSGFLVAIISHQLRDLGRTEGPSSVAFYFALFSSPVLALGLPFVMTSHTPLQWLILISLGAVGTATQMLLSAALRYGAVASVVIMDYTALIWTMLLGWLVWDHVPSAAMWLGAPLIVAAGLVIGWRERKLALERSPVSAAEND